MSDNALMCVAFMFWYIHDQTHAPGWWHYCARLVWAILRWIQSRWVELSRHLVRWEKYSRQAGELSHPYEMGLNAQICFWRWLSKPFVPVLLFGFQHTFVLWYLFQCIRPMLFDYKLSQASSTYLAPLTHLAQLLIILLSALINRTSKPRVLLFIWTSKTWYLNCHLVI